MTTACFHKSRIALRCNGLRLSGSVLVLFGRVFGAVRGSFGRVFGPAACASAVAARAIGRAGGGEGVRVSGGTPPMCI